MRRAVGHAVERPREDRQRDTRDDEPRGGQQHPARDRAVGEVLQLEEPSRLESQGAGDESGGGARSRLGQRPGGRGVGLGEIGDRPLPPLLLRMLRYTPVAVLPALAAPLVLWPAATEGQTDPARLAAAIATVVVGVITRSALAAILAGAAMLSLGLYLS